MSVENRKSFGLMAAAGGGLVLPHIYWLLAVKGIGPIPLLPGNTPILIGVALLAVGVLPLGALLFATGRRRSNFVVAASLGLFGAIVAAVLNYWAISWWYATFFYNA